MLLTITMNPSIDIAYQLENFQLDTVNRLNEIKKTPGGKGLNVTRVLKQLDEPVLASGLVGGVLGQDIKQKLQQMAIAEDFFTIAGETRNCIAILHDNQQTELLESGPTITAEEAHQFLAHFEKLVQQATTVSISGSLPKGLPVDYYVSLIALCHQYNTKVILDCSGASLAAVLQSEHKPFVIKPNTEELSQLLNETITKDTEQLKNVLKQPLFAGIEWVIVSLGADGMFAKHLDTYYRVTIPKIAVVNPVGSGDSTVAGISSALYHQETDEQLLKKANTLGMLNAMEAATGYVDLQKYQMIYDQIIVNRV